jgi:hypothetical protein
VLAEAIRVSQRGVSRRGLSVRLWLALEIAAALDGSVTTAAMLDLATGQLPRDLQWEMQILVADGKSGNVRTLTAKQLYNLGELITKHPQPRRRGPGRHRTLTAGRAARLSQRGTHGRHTRCANHQYQLRN